MLMSGRTIPTILGKGQRFPGFGPPPTPWSFDSVLELSPLGVSFHLLIQDQGLVLFAILVPFDSSQFMLCHWATSFFQKLCPAAFPPVTYSSSILLSMDVQQLVVTLVLSWEEMSTCPLTLLS